MQMQQLAQEQEDVKEQQKVLQQQQERLLKEQDSLRQREVFVRKMFYDVSANLAVADHMVGMNSNLVSQQSHAISPLVSQQVITLYGITIHDIALQNKNVVSPPLQYLRPRG